MATIDNYTSNLKQVNVSSSIDDSAKLQKLINSTGNTPAKFVFSEKSEIEVSSQISFYNACELAGNEVVFRLRDKVSETIFPAMKSIIGAKSLTPTNFIFNGLVFDGNYNAQVVTLGKAYHNFIGISNASNIIITNCNIHDSAGDGARLTNVKNVNYSNNKIIRCGHDAVYIDKGQDVEVCNNYVELRTNSGCRLRHVINGYAHDNYIINKVAGKASCPGMQIEVSTSGMKSSNIVLENNQVFDTWGPGVWVVGLKNADISTATDLIIRNNLFSNCGNMDSDYHHIPGVGGITCEGWDNVLIEENKFENCLGYGVLFGEYVSASAAGSGYSAVVKNNSFIGTRKSNTVGTASGTALANLKPDKYTKVEAYGNSYSGNVQDMYNVTEQVKTPEEPDSPAYVKFECPESKIDGLKVKYNIYKRLNHE